jgi:hypothetical protein
MTPASKEKTVAIANSVGFTNMSPDRIVHRPLRPAIETRIKGANPLVRQPSETTQIQILFSPEALPNLAARVGDENHRCRSPSLHVEVLTGQTSTTTPSQLCDPMTGCPGLSVGRPRRLQCDPEQLPGITSCDPFLAALIRAYPVGPLARLETRAANLDESPFGPNAAVFGQRVVAVVSYQTAMPSRAALIWAPSSVRCDPRSPCRLLPWPAEARGGARFSQLRLAARC